MAYAYRQQTRFCPTIQTASVRFPKKIEYRPGCPAPNGCALGAVTNVTIDSNAIVRLDSTYKMKGADCFQIGVSNVINSNVYSFKMMGTLSNEYLTCINLSEDALCVVSVSPIINSYICTTCNVNYTNIVPSAPFGVRTTTSNIKWNSPIIPENYGLATITSYTISGIYLFGRIPSSPSNNTWSSVALSETGQFQAVSSLEGYVYTSSNYGNVWSSNSTGGVPLNSVALSADGVYQIAVGSNIPPYSSSNSGNTWTYMSTFPDVIDGRSIALSSNGQYQTIGTSFGDIYSSSNFGQSWTSVQYVVEPIVSIAMSPGGLYQRVFGSNINIYTSENGGTNWSYSNYPDPHSPFTSAAISANGDYQTIVGGYYMFTSFDRGSTWNPTFTPAYPNPLSFQKVAMSANGQYQIAVDSSSGLMFTTSNAWDTYSSQTMAGNPRWKSIAISSDGTSYQTALDINNKIIWNNRALSNIPITNPNLTFVSNQYSLSLTVQYTQTTQIGATNMAGTGAYSRPG